VFERRGVDRYVLGAQAISVRGAPRATHDVDVTANVARPEVAASMASLTEAGLEHRFPDVAGELIATISGGSPPGR